MKDEKFPAPPYSPLVTPKPKPEPVPETEPIWGDTQRSQDYDPDDPNTHPLDCDCFLCIPGA